MNPQPVERSQSLYILITLAAISILDVFGSLGY